MVEVDRVVQLKFEPLQQDLLTYVAEFGTRVLHLSSDHLKKDCLCIEGENGVSKSITTKELYNLLKPSNIGNGKE